MYANVPAGTSIADGSAILDRRPSTKDQKLLSDQTSRSEASTSQSEDASFHGAHRMHHHPRGFESLDYEEVENTVYRADQAASGTLDSVAYTSAKWAICFMIGIITALAAFAVNVSVENISGFKFWATLSMSSRGHYIPSFLVYVTINAALVVASVAITVYVGPAAAGSGIAEVKAYLNGVNVPGIFYFRTLFAKIVGAVGSVSGGLAIGKEGPFVHAGAGIAALLSQGSSSVQLPVFKRFWNDRDRNDLIACGAAAGVAAAFRAPLGGVLFAVEEMTSWFKNSWLWQAFFTTAVVSVAIRVLMKACSEKGCGFFGSGGFIIFEIAEGQDAYEFYELLPMLLLGVIGGLLGSSFIVLNARLNEWRREALTKYGARGKLIEGLLISLLTSAVSFLLPLMFECQPCPPDAGDSCPRQDNSHSGNFVTFGCSAPHEYHGLATLFFNTQDDAIRNLFSSKTKREYTVQALLTFTTAFYLLAVITSGISCPTGLFVPSILCGAAYGRLVGIFVADMHPHHYVDEGTYALLGAASFLGGSMRMTVCTCVMLLELTDNLALLPLIMLVLLVAKAVGDGTGVKPIYEVQMCVKGMPFMDPAPEGYMRHITAKECCGRPPVTFQRVERVSNLVTILRSCSHNGFPVTHRGQGLDSDSHIIGVITRHQLLVLLSSKRALQQSPLIAEAAGRAAVSYSVSDFSKGLCALNKSVDELKLTAEELDWYLDLGPYVNPSYYVVQEDASLSKVYTLFRTLGLRHVCVIPRANEVVGIITRHDMLPETIEDRFQGLGQYTTAGNKSGAFDARPPTPNHDDNGSSTSAGAYGFLNRRSRLSPPLASPLHGSLNQLASAALPYHPVASNGNPLSPGLRGPLSSGGGIG